ncbi:MAG: hypothetical protein J0L84_05605 [Verrucomicrobia bacterium]|nr:hypothetical protein [Verrucomicrobiota bacterium]
MIRDVHEIAHWMADTDCDGANVIVRQDFCCDTRDELDDRTMDTAPGGQIRGWSGGTQPDNTSR